MCCVALKMSKFLSFVNSCPSPFHAVETVKKSLVESGFKEILEGNSWQSLQKGSSYFFTRNSSAIIAFCIGGQYEPGSAFTIIGAHTDSPCLKIKPKSKKEKAGYDQVGVETYGGGLWNTWFDRDLAVAGRVFVHAKDSITERLVHIKQPILRIPTLAIHLDRSVSDGFKFNNEAQLCPILQLTEKSLNSDAEKVNGIHHLSLLNMIAKDLNVQVDQIGEFELCLYDTQPAAIGGAKNEFIFSARLDNLMMSYCSIEALLQAVHSLQDDKCIRIVGLFDNEEVGSTTSHGANSNLLESCIRRLSGLSFGSQWVGETTSV
jgi:aspartyl aminopeptidase